MIALAPTPSARAEDQTPTPLRRIGVYDSRAVAVAYAGSTVQTTKMKELKARWNKAGQTGDTNTLSQLELEGKAWQSSLNQQGFGTAPVDDLLLEIADNLPAIQQAAGVTKIISKWDKTELARHPRAAQVDVTMPLVDAFQPNASQRKHAVEVQKTKPQKIKE